MSHFILYLIILHTDFWCIISHIIPYFKSYVIFNHFPGRMLRREKVAKPSAFGRKQDGVGGSDGTGVKQKPDDDVEYYSVTDVYAGEETWSRVQDSRVKYSIEE